MKKMIKMDMYRSLFSIRTFFSLAGMCVFLILSAEDMLMQWMQHKTTYGAIDLLLQPMAMDKYKVIMAVILCGIYTDAYCQDEKNGNLRNVLLRTDIVSYIVSKVLVNMLSIILIAGLSFTITYCIFCMLGIPGECKGYAAYYNIAYTHPYAFVLMTALEFGLVISACSMVGILISSMHPSPFVSIGCAGLAFFLAVSFIPLGSIFDVYNLISMWPILPGGRKTPQVIMFLWGILYPLCVIGICTVLFYYRLMRRINHGTL